jgi:hypothetical protein
MLVVLAVAVASEEELGVVAPDLPRRRPKNSTRKWPTTSRLATRMRQPTAPPRRLLPTETLPWMMRSWYVLQPKLPQTRADMVLTFGLVNWVSGYSCGK